MRAADTQVVVHLREPRWLSTDKVTENPGQFTSQSKHCEEAARAEDFILPASFNTAELLKFPVSFYFDILLPL